MKLQPSPVVLAAPPASHIVLGSLAALRPHAQKLSRGDPLEVSLPAKVPTTVSVDGKVKREKQDMDLWQQDLVCSMREVALPRQDSVLCGWVMGGHGVSLHVGEAEDIGFINTQLVRR